MDSADIGTLDLIDGEMKREGRGLRGRDKSRGQPQSRNAIMSSPTLSFDPARIYLIGLGTTTTTTAPKPHRFGRRYKRQPTGERERDKLAGG